MQTRLSTCIAAASGSETRDQSAKMVPNALSRSRSVRWRSLGSAIALAVGVHTGASAGPVTAGPAITSVPAALADPLSTLVAGLGTGQFLVPVIATAASDMGSWSFNLAFDASVANPFDAGGLFQYVYQAEFASGRPSQITSSGIVLTALIDCVSGYFDPLVSGDGPLAYLLFRFNAGEEGMDPGIHVVTQPGNSVPTPNSISLAVLALSLLFATRPLARGAPPHARRASLFQPQ